MEDISRCVNHSPLGIPKMHNNHRVMGSNYRGGKSQIIQTEMKKNKQHQRLQYPSYKEP